MYETQLRKISENRIIKLIIMKDNQLNKTEEQRITIAFGIIATTIALLAFIDSGFWSFFKGLFSISGISAFIYILLTGTKLKYKDEKIIRLYGGTKQDKRNVLRFINRYLWE